MFLFSLTKTLKQAFYMNHTWLWGFFTLLVALANGVPFQILEDQLTLFQPGGTDYAHLITTGTHGFLDIPTALQSEPNDRGHSLV